MNKGLIFDIKRYAIHDGPGIRTTIFMKGCPLNCVWCHNPEGIKSKIEKITSYKNNFKKEQKEVIGYYVDKDELLNIILKDKIFYDESKGGITFSGGEPLLQIEFLKKMLNECKKHNIHTTIDTSGYSSIDNIKQIYNDVDLFLYDIKFIDEKKHIKYTQKSNKIILKNLKYLTNMGKKVQIRIPLIPKITDKKDNLKSIKIFLDGLKNINEICLLPYNKLAESKRKKYYKNLEFLTYSTQSEKFLNDVKKLFDSGKYVIKIGG